MKYEVPLGLQTALPKCAVVTVVEAEVVAEVEAEVVAELV